MKRMTILLALLSICGVIVAQSSGDSVSQKTDTTGVVIIQPQFKGGAESFNKYIQDNFVYPEDAKRRSVEGKIVIEFSVEKSGAITYPGVIKGLDDMVDDEIVRLFKSMPRWTPATKNGVPIRFKMLMTMNIKASRHGLITSSEEVEELFLELSERRDFY